MFLSCCCTTSALSPYLVPEIALSPARYMVCVTMCPACAKSAVASLSSKYLGLHLPLSVLASPPQLEFIPCAPSVPSPQFLLRPWFGGCLRFPSQRPPLAATFGSFHLLYVRHLVLAGNAQMRSEDTNPRHISLGLEYTDRKACTFCAVRGAPGASRWCALHPAHLHPNSCARAIYAPSIALRHPHTPDRTASLLSFYDS